MLVLVEIIQDKDRQILGENTVSNSSSAALKNEAIKLIKMPDFDSFYHDKLNKLTNDPQLLVAIKAMRLAALGHFDHAQLLTAMIYQFESRNSLVRYLLDELAWRLAFYSRHEGIIVSAV